MTSDILKVIKETNMGKKIEIRVYGYGGEIVQDLYTDDEVQQIDDYIEENGEDLINIMAEVEEILPERYGWYECDGELHLYGCFAEHARISVGIDDEWTDFNGEYPIMDIEEKGTEVEYEEVGYFAHDANVITIMSEEKGTFLDCDFELEEGEFDYSKLKLDIKDVIFRHVDEYGEEYLYEQSIITSIYYDDEMIGDHGGDTRGKGMSAYIQRKDYDES